jgi:hypothetical protein
MSVILSDIVFCGSANMPDVDGATTGGAINAAISTSFADMAAAGSLTYYSSSASDTAAIITVTGRDAAGVLQTEAKTLTGTTGVVGSQSFERLMKALASGTTAVGDIAALSTATVVTGTAVGGSAASASAPAQITLASGQGASVALGQVIRITNNLPAGVNFQLRRIIGIVGDVVSVNRDWGTVPTSATTYDVRNGMLLAFAPVQITQVRRMFYNVAADVAGGASRVYYEKLFTVNNNASLALTTASIIKQVDPATGTLDFALETTLGGSGSSANRQTLPTGISSWSSGAAPQTIAVQGTGNLAPAAASPQGVWMRLTLAAGTAAAKTSDTMRATGAST